MVPRITHSIEITADSFAYAGLLVLLFSAAGKSEEARAEPKAEARLKSA